MENLNPAEQKDTLKTQQEKPLVKNEELTNYPDECFCPSCGKFVGAYERCPMCQADMKVRMELKLVKRIAVFGAIIGLILLWFASKNREIPTIQVDSIKINNNMAIVKIIGTVLNINVNETSKNFSLTLDDDTGTIKVINAGKLDDFRAKFREKFPQPGDRIEVIGNVSISEKWGASMFLASTRRMKVLEKTQMDELKLGEVADKHLNQTVMIKGVEIIKVSKYTIGQNIIVKDESGELPLNVFDSDLTKIENMTTRKALLLPGTKITFKAVIKKYKTQLQLALADPRDPSSIIIDTIGNDQGNPSAEKKTVILIPVSEINQDFQNRTVSIKGEITNVLETNSGKLITLKEGESTINVWIPANMNYTDTLDKGKLLQVKGKVSSYREKLQIVPFGTDCIIKI